MLLKLDVWHQRCAYLNKLFCKSFWRGILVRHMRREFGNANNESILRSSLIVFILNYRTSVLFPSQRNAELRNQLIHFPVTLTLSWCSPRLKLRVGLGSRILSLRVYDRELFISFHVQAVVRYVGETNRHVATRIREHLSSHKRSHIFTHLRGSENCRSLVQKIVLKFLTLLPQASN